MFTQDDIIYAYTRQMAIEDGQQVNIKSLNLDNQFFSKLEIFLTSGVFELIEKAVNNKRHCNDLQGVWHDIAWMCFNAARRNLDTDTIEFVVIITGTGRKRNHRLVAQIGPVDIDDPRPALTIMLPEEM